MLQHTHTCLNEPIPKSRRQKNLNKKIQFNDVIEQQDIIPSKVKFDGNHLSLCSSWAHGCYENLAPLEWLEAFFPVTMTVK